MGDTAAQRTIGKYIYEEKDKDHLLTINLAFVTWEAVNNNSS